MLREQKVTYITKLSFKSIIYILYGILLFSPLVATSVSKAWSKIRFPGRKV
jgi:hypothetical protein